mmetsp:Transcript_14063/g.49528  ORF Transcript_14063/g.49528 Transcript_14063/m.49528 type:complete len:454 (-) Transcript_14063:76-1437(-)
MGGTEDAMAPKALATKKKAVAKVKNSTLKEKKYKVTKQRGKTAIVRAYSDPEAYAQRRQQEKPPPGGWPTPPAHWPAGVRVHVGRPVFWIPKGWGHGIKTTCVTRLDAFVSPEGKMYYHRCSVEEVIGRKLGPDDNLASAKNWARQQVLEGKDWRGKPAKFDPDARLFACLSQGEKEKLVEPGAFHVAVISARRASEIVGLRAVVGVQAQLVASGATPVWYVDAASAAEYRQLGLKVEIGGKLVPARNKALSDAQKLGKPCLQVSDDITHWSYYKGDDGPAGNLPAGNEAAKKSTRIRISPMAAARFLLAKMRGVPAGQSQPKLGGVFPLGNTGMAFVKGANTSEHFILGDFFVQDVGTKCKFDTDLTLKEDYDFTCTHLAKHGAVLRCNRMFVAAVHETNPGGACSERDGAGDKERANIAILQRKWPGVFSLNGNRGDGSTQVTMAWRRRRV